MVDARDLMPSQSPLMKFLKPSQTPFIHSTIAPQFLIIAMTATIAATIPAITATTGAAAVSAAPIAGITVPVITLPSPASPAPPISPPIAVTAPPITVMIVPIADINEPRIINTGPTTAAIIAAFIINCCVSGLRPLHHSATPLMALARSSKTGAKVSPIEEPTSARASFIWFEAFVILSIGSSVPSNVVSTVSPQSRTTLSSSVNDSLPSCTACAIEGPALFPNSSIAICICSVPSFAPSICVCSSERA